jgi:hypothetical protein
MTNRTHPTNEGNKTPRGIEQYRARARIADAALSALGY